MEIITAIYENGVLRPLGPVELDDHEVVTITVSRAAAPAHGESTLFEVLDEVGLIGCIKDAPPDLSSNPAHLEGFGKSGG